MKYIDVNQEFIYAVLNKEDADRLCRYMAGCRVMFSKRATEQRDIIRDYNNMVATGCKNSDAVKSLSAKYEKSESQIRRIIQKWKRS